MALDKLVDSTQLDADLSSVADAIRAKSGGSGSLAFPAGFVSEIGAIETGGGSGGWSTDGIADGSEPNGGFTVSAQTLRNYAFAYCSDIGNVVFSNATAIREGLFKGATFDTLSFPLAATYANSSSAFESATGNRVTFGALPTGTNWQYWFRNANIAIVDFPSCFESIPQAMFYGSCATRKIILRKDGVVTLTANNVIFTNQAFAEALTVYVPSARIAEYQAATNWSTAYGYNSNLFQAIEGSEFE